MAFSCSWHLEIENLRNLGSISRRTIFEFSYFRRELNLLIISWFIVILAEGPEIECERENLSGRTSFISFYMLKGTDGMKEKSIEGYVLAEPSRIVPRVLIENVFLCLLSICGRVFLLSERLSTLHLSFECLLRQNPDSKPYIWVQSKIFSNVFLRMSVSKVSDDPFLSMIFLECVRSCDFSKVWMWWALLWGILMEFLREVSRESDTSESFVREASMLINSNIIMQATHSKQPSPVHHISHHQICIPWEWWVFAQGHIGCRVIIQYSINLVEMFQNSYQNGTFFELFDPKMGQEKLKTLYRTANVNAINKVFDKQLKTFVMEFATPNAKMILPKQQKKDLYLIQQYLNLQIYFHQGFSWSIELVVSDLTKTKRRIILSPATTKTQVKPFFVKTQCSGYQEGCWNNFIVDLYSFIQAFKGQTYRSLDSLTISGHFKIKRIFTSSTVPFDVSEQGYEKEGNQISFLPKHFYFPPDVLSVAKMNRYNGAVNADSASTISMTENSTKNSSFLKAGKPKVVHANIKKEELIPRTEKAQQVKKAKRFLSNTSENPLSCKKISHKEEEPPKLSKIEQQKKTSKSGEKYLKKRQLIKTQQIPVKADQPNDKISTKKSQVNEKTKAKINPWRTNKKQTAASKDLSEIIVPKTCQQRCIDTPQTVSIFKGKNNLTSKFSQTKNNHFESKCEQYSDSEYFELSQKFSTLTDGKFFKNQLINMTRHHFESEAIQDEEDEIEENIEMEANSISSSVKKTEHNHNQNALQIHQPIFGLNKAESKIMEYKCDELARSSLYGFGEQLMKNFMEQVERPYSPPLLQKEVTEQQLSQNYHHDQKEEVELIYDPVLNCYYDHRTHTYYELKN